MHLVNSIQQTYKVLNGRTYREYIHRACDEIEIKRYSPANIRKTFMTNATKAAIKKDVSLHELSLVTGHASFTTTDKYYVEKKLIEYLETMYKCNIEQVEIHGKVQKNYKNESNERVVEGGCGYCDNSNLECPVLGTAPCFMCKCGGFVTTIENQKDFERMIAMLDQKMEQSSDNHTREHLYAVKQICLKYLYEIMILKGENNAE